MNTLFQANSEIDYSYQNYLIAFFEFSGSLVSKLLHVGATSSVWS